MKKCQTNHAMERFCAKGNHVKWKSVKNSCVMEGFRAKGGRREPKGAQWEPKGSQRGAKGSQTEPKGGQKGAKGSQRGAKRGAKKAPWGRLGSTRGSKGQKHQKTRYFSPI